MERYRIINSGLPLFFDNEVNVDYVINRCREREKRYIAIISTQGKPKYVLKMFSNCYTTKETIISWNNLATLFDDGGITTPTFIENDRGNIVEDIMIDGIEYLVWVEHFVYSKYQDDDGIDIEQESEECLYTIGRLKGKMHCLSKQHNMHGLTNTPYVLFEPFCIDDDADENYENVLRLKDKLWDTNNTRIKSYIEKIWTTYICKRDELELIYKILPSGQIQGDFSTDNFIIDDSNKIVGIYDYNLSGEDRYISDCIQEGIFLCYACYNDPNWGENEEYVNTRFREYLRGYLEEYILCKEELYSIDLLYNISRPMRYENIKDLISKYENNDFEDVERKLLWMDSELNRTGVMNYIGL